MQGAVGAELEGLGEGLQRRHQIASARGLLELMQDAAHVMSKASQSCASRTFCTACLGFFNLLVIYITGGRERGSCIDDGFLSRAPIVATASLSLGLQPPICPLV